jgi:hypothetical protein
MRAQCNPSAPATRDPVIGRIGVDLTCKQLAAFLEDLHPIRRVDTIEPGIETTGQISRRYLRQTHESIVARYFAGRNVEPPIADIADVEKMIDVDDRPGQRGVPPAA